MAPMLPCGRPTWEPADFSRRSAALAGPAPYARTMTTVSESTWDLPLTTIDGQTTSLRAFDGQALLVVNVASRCGLAPQYEKLEELQKTYGERGLTVLGFPSNQFLQELGSEDA